MPKNRFWARKCFVFFHHLLTASGIAIRQQPAEIRAELILITRNHKKPLVKNASNSMAR